MTDVIMPQMGESIAEGTVIKWLKAVGDRVERDEPLFEISTDKVDAEIPSPAAGILREIRTQVGEIVAVGSVVGLIGQEGEASPPQVDPSAAAPVAVPVSDVGAATIPPRPVVPPAAAHAAPSVPDSDAGNSEAPAPSVEELRLSRSSPVVRRIAAEHKIDIGQLRGTGISGRVTKQNILDHIAQRAGGGATAPAVATTTAQRPAPVVPAYLPGEAVEIVRMSPIRRKTAEHMLLSKRTSAHVSTVFEVDMTRVDALRKQHKRTYLERNGVKLTYLPFIAKVTVDALKEFPLLNTSVQGDNVVYRKGVNLGIAVALENGLIVPVVRAADEKNILGLTRAIGDLADRARTKKLAVEEVQGGTFTITNPGVFGSLFGTPIINQPQVAILGVGTVEPRPVVRDDAIAIRTMCYLALTFDHRIVDGADADRFMARLKRGLEEFDGAAL